MEYDFKIRKRSILFIILALTIGIIGATIAFYNTYNANQSAYYAANYNVFLEQEWDGTWGDKNITIRNEGTTPVVLRLSYKEAWSKEIENENILINNIYADNNVVNKDWSNTFLNDFTYYNGWYYYNKPLNSNESIVILNGVNKIDTNGSYNYNDYNYELSFYYETVQSTKNAIKSLWNITPDINDDQINWNT